ncbi:MAG: hypothetical protein JWN70_1614 [Planctomycetaceae bacterium]|nr:hypothetical protein [Planctomycetaceae bacterium]
MTSSATAFGWNKVLTLDAGRNIIGGSPQVLRDAIAHGADLRIYSEFHHNEHIDTTSHNNELIQETMDMRATYLIDGRWCGGILTLRQPVDLPHGFGPRPSLSLFMYNEDGQQAIARPHLDGPPASGTRGPAALADRSDMPKYHELDSWDVATNAPSSNFIYDFNTLRYFVRDDWKLLLHHSAKGEVISGSRAAVADAFARGVEWKLGISGLCSDLIPADQPALAHEVFIQAGSCYLYTQQELLIAASHPVARVRPAIPLQYATGNWDYAWLVARTDGQIAKLIYDPYTLASSRSSDQHEIRWFCR